MLPVTHAWQVWGPVRIAWARVSDVGVTRSIPERLGEGQGARFDDLGRADAARFVTSRMLIADAIAQVAGKDADVRISTECEWCGGAHGAVRHEAGRVALSVSYADDLVAVAAADLHEVHSIGVDIEGIDGELRTAELGRVFAPLPVPSLAEWTRIEAVLKADGRGLHVDPRAVRCERGVFGVSGTPSTSGAPGTPGVPGAPAAAEPARPPTAAQGPTPPTPHALRTRWVGTASVTADRSVYEVATFAEPRGYLLSAAVARPSRSAAAP